jgi:hypothetical protein
LGSADNREIIINPTPGGGQENHCNQGEPELFLHRHTPWMDLLSLNIQKQSAELVQIGFGLCKGLGYGF